MLLQEMENRQTGRQADTYTYMHIFTHSHERRSCGDGDRDWRDMDELRNMEDCWPPAKAKRGQEGFSPRCTEEVWMCSHAHFGLGSRTVS
jgi:hypothetical protein